MRLNGTPFVGHDRRLRERALGLSIVFFLHAGFLLLLAQSALRPTFPVRGVVREMMLVLPRLSRPTPARRQNAVPGANTTPVAPVFAPPPIVSSPLVAPFAAVVPSPDSIRGFGQTLFGCSPQNYNNLPVDQRVRCPPPSGGASQHDEPIILNPPSQAKDEAFWQEQWKEDHWGPGLCIGPGVLNCINAQRREENARSGAARDAIAAQKAAAVKARPPTLDERLLTPHP